MEIDSAVAADKTDRIEVAPVGKDTFCWLCHRQRTQHTVYCSTCIRSYHVYCMKGRSVSIDETTWQCPECVEIEKSENDLVGRDFDVQLIKHIMNQILQNQSFRLFELPLNEADHPGYFARIMNPVSLIQIKRNVAERKYRSLSGFLTDVKWINHNTCIYFKGVKKYTRVSSLLVKFCKDEIKSIETCVDCFVNANSHQNWFTMVCPKPHLIIWGKMYGFPFWPAKLMVVNGDHADIRFFGDHKHANVPIKKCFLFSRVNPAGQTNDTSTSNALGEAMSEANSYIMNLRAEFGDYVLSEPKVPFDPTKMEEYMKTIMHPVTMNTLSTPSTSRATDNRSKVTLLDLTINQTREKNVSSAATSRHELSQTDLRENNVFEVDDNGARINNKRRRSPSASDKTANNNRSNPTNPERPIAKSRAPSLLKSRETVANDQRTRHVASTQFSINNSNIDSIIDAVFRDLMGDQLQEMAQSIHVGFESKLNECMKQFRLTVNNRLLEMKLEKLKLEHKKELEKMRIDFEKEVADIKTKQWCNSCDRSTSTVYFCGPRCQKMHMDEMVSAQSPEQ